MVTFIKKVYFISHTATAYQMDKNVSFFHKGGTKKGNKGSIGVGASPSRSLILPRLKWKIWN